MGAVCGTGAWGTLRVYFEMDGGGEVLGGGAGSGICGGIRRDIEDISDQISAIRKQRQVQRGCRDSWHIKRAMENRTSTPAKRTGRTHRAAWPDAPDCGAEEKSGPLRSE